MSLENSSGPTSLGSSLSHRQLGPAIDTCPANEMSHSVNMISSHYSQGPSKYQILSTNYFQMWDGIKKYCLWEPWLGLTVKLIKRHISDHWSHLWREVPPDLPSLLPPPSNNNLQQISCQIPGGGWGSSLAHTFLALLNNIPVIRFHTKHKTMNE